MSKVKLPLLLALVIGAGVAAGAEFDPYDIREESEQIVLYTIHRGGRETLREAISELFDLAREKKMATKGHFTLVALNNPSQSSSKHILTEIQIPVDVDALKIPADTFENKMTDIKTIPPHEVAFWPARGRETTKDSFRIYKGLYRWIVDRGEVPMFGPRQTFFVNYYRDDYDQMETEIKVPIWKTVHPPGE